MIKPDWNHIARCARERGAGFGDCGVRLLGMPGPACPDRARYEREYETFIAVLAHAARLARRA